MPSNPSARHLIPSWLIITTAIFVIVMLVITIGGLSPFRQFSVTESKTTHTIYEPAKGKQPVSKEVEEAQTTQRPTPWDILGLVFVPIVGGIIITIVSHTYNKRQREREEAVQTLRAQDELLQKYLDQMSDLLVNRGLRPEPADAERKGLQKYVDQVDDLLINLNLRSEPADAEPKSHIRKLAQARTIAALLGLDSEHKERPLKLVYELGLIGKGNPILKLRNAGLDGANLSELTLHQASLKSFDLRLSDLKGADLGRSNLNLADLRGSDLRRADLKGADLTEANLLPYDARDPERWSRHNLKKAINFSKLPTERLCPRRLRLARALNIGLPWRTFRKLRWRGVRPTIAELTVTSLKGATLDGATLPNSLLGGADLTNADLSGAVLTDAILTDADLSGAVLTDAVLTGTVLYKAVGVTSEQLKACGSLKGATMPNGQKYEDWLKSKGSGEAGENSGPS
jgi:uncharacterized protein YjbI with pentapeptide repeats